MIDLHSHTTASDGTLTPTEIVERAVNNKVTHLALTDHDTIAGIEEAMKASSDQDINIIPGIEFSTRWGDHEVHVVGLGIDIKHKQLLRELTSIQQDRLTRNDRMAERLQELGYDVTKDEAAALAGGDILTRAHFAKLLVKKGYFETMPSVFDTLLGNNCPGYIKRKTLSSAEAVDLIHLAGGKAILAHPLLYGMDDMTLCALIKNLKEHGLDGIEAYYHSFSPEQTAYVVKLAKHFGLQLSGGSDFHGDNRPGVDVGIGRGNLNISAEILEKLNLYLLP